MGTTSIVQWRGRNAGFLRSDFEDFSRAAPGHAPRHGKRAERVIRHL